MTYRALALCPREWSNCPTNATKQFFFRNSVSPVYSDDHIVWSCGWRQSFQDCFLNDSDWRTDKVGEVIIRFIWGVVYWSVIFTSSAWRLVCLIRLKDACFFWHPLIERRMVSVNQLPKGSRWKWYVLGVKQQTALATNVLRKSMMFWDMSR